MKKIGWIGLCIFCLAMFVNGQAAQNQMSRNSQSHTPQVQAFHNQSSNSIAHNSNPNNASARSAAKHDDLAPTPPMGWNSWDGYGTTIDEAEFKANADWMAKHLAPYGWKYATIDMEWFVTNPTAGGNSKNSHYAIDEFGRYVPDPNRFASAKNGQGFRPLADYAHARGLKFGIHILQGIPKEAVEKNLQIFGSSYHAKDAADVSKTCSWNPDNYGLNAESAAARAYYNSIAKLYAGWGVDFLKVDCIASGPYKGDEIRLLSEAIAETGRPIVLSLSPGPAPLEKLQELRRYAQMWRISNDIWDIWHSNVAYPQGLGDQFANVAKWAGLAVPGHWPDADMLPLGYLGPEPGWGKPRASRLTHDEQRTLMTLWCIFGSPLMVGGRLPSMDDWTLSLLTNREVLAVDQHNRESKPVVTTDKIIVWHAESDDGKHYMAVFNVSDAPQKITSWEELGLSSGKYRLRDLWEHKDLGVQASPKLELAPHASVLWRYAR